MPITEETRWDNEHLAAFIALTEWGEHIKENKVSWKHSGNKEKHWQGQGDFKLSEPVQANLSGITKAELMRIFQTFRDVGGKALLDVCQNFAV